MDNQGKQVKMGTQDTGRRQTKQKTHHYANMNNVNKTWTLLQTTEGKDEPRRLQIIREVVVNDISQSVHRFWRLIISYRKECVKRESHKHQDSKQGNQRSNASRIYLLSKFPSGVCKCNDVLIVHYHH